MENLRRVFMRRQPTFRNIPRSVRRVWGDLLRGALHEVVTFKSVEAWVRLCLLPTCVLGTHGLYRGPLRARGRAVGSHRLIRRRADLWARGCYGECIQELLQAPLQPVAAHVREGDAWVHGKILRLVGEGHFGAAVKYLSPATVAPLSAETAAEVQKLFPEGPLLEDIGDGSFSAFDLF